MCVWGVEGGGGGAHHSVPVSTYRLQKQIIFINWFVSKYNTRIEKNKKKKRRKKKKRKKEEEKEKRKKKKGGGGVGWGGGAHHRHTDHTNKLLSLTGAF